MTVNELKKILKSNTFKSSFEQSNQHYLFSFTEIYIFRDNENIGIYELKKIDNNFVLILKQKQEKYFMGTFKNVILNVINDERFPIVINFDALQLQQNGFSIKLESQ